MTPACGEIVAVLADDTMAKSRSPDLTSCRICGSCPNCAPGYWSTSILPSLNSLSLAENKIVSDAVAGIELLIVGETISASLPARSRAGRNSQACRET